MRTLVFRSTFTLFLVLFLCVGLAGAAVITAEPDDFAAETVLDSAFPGMTLSGDGSHFADEHVYALDWSYTSTGDKVFGNSSTFGGSPDIRRYWSLGVADLRIDFAFPADSVSIDAIGASSTSLGRLEAYDAAGVLVTWYHSTGLGLGEVETMTVSVPDYSIAYVLAGGRPDKGGVYLDNLQADVVPEPSTFVILSSLLSALGIAFFVRRRK